MTRSPTLASDRVALQANVDEQEQSLTEEEEEIDGLRSDIENLNGQVTELTDRVNELQTDLDATLAAKAQAEEQLQATESALAELQQQVDGAQEQLRALLPEDVLAQLTAEQAVEPVAAEGEPVAAEGEPCAEGELRLKANLWRLKASQHKLPRRSKVSRLRSPARQRFLAWLRSQQGSRLSSSKAGKSPRSWTRRPLRLRP